jgi:hypothetical protein
LKNFSKLYFCSKYDNFVLSLGEELKNIVTAHLTTVRAAFLAVTAVRAAFLAVTAVRADFLAITTVRTGF